MAARLKLPHIPRVISATIFPDMANFLLWALLIAVISLNVVLARITPLLYLPPAPTQKQVLGVTTTNQMPYWQAIVTAHPDYRDAYISLAGIAYKQGNLALTKSFLAQAAALDPNGKTVQNLLKFINKLIGK